MTTRLMVNGQHFFVLEERIDGVWQLADAGIARSILMSEAHKNLQLGCALFVEDGDRSRLFRLVPDTGD